MEVEDKVPKYVTDFRKVKVERERERGREREEASPRPSLRATTESATKGPGRRNADVMRRKSEECGP
jgi:hypothetical protein